MIAALALGVQIPDRLALAHVSIQGSPMFFPCHATRLELDPGVLARQAVNRLLELIATPGAVPAPVMLKPAVLNALAPDNARAKRAASPR